MRLWGFKAIVMAVALLLFSFSGLSLEPPASDRQICNVSADTALGLEEYATAITLHQRVLHFRPGDALAHYHLGFAYGMAGRISEELDEYRKAIALGLNHWDLYLNLGLVYADLGKLTQATNALEHAELLARDRPETHFNLALIYEREGQLSASLKEIMIVRRLDPRDLDAANINAILCVEMGNRICAQKLWAHLVQTAPEYYPARINLKIFSQMTRPRIVRLPGDSRSPAIMTASPVSLDNTRGSYPDAVARPIRVEP